MIDPQLSPAELCSRLAQAGVRRFFLVWDEAAGRVVASHPLVEPLAHLLEGDERDFDRHEAVFAQIAPDSGQLQAVFLHRTCRGQGAGGVRLWPYQTVEGLLRDGLRLSRGMTNKNALAGIWWGGGKGIMARNTGAGVDDPALRRRAYEEYGELLTSLQGAYITAEDVGTTVEDMAAVFSRTRFTTCIPPALGGSGNPSGPTARGVVRGMEAALAHRGLGDLKGKSVLVQGLGHVGSLLIGLLKDRGTSKVIGFDIDPRRHEPLLARHPSAPGWELDLRTAAPGDLSLLSEPVDLFAPCATGGVLNPSTIPIIAAPIVCGAANNQLEDPHRDDRHLRDRGLLYVPDFLVNRMGIVHCADEQYGYVETDPREEVHLGDGPQSIYQLTRQVLAEAESTGTPPGRVALDLAERRSFDLHPLWGHRGAAIIRSLVADGWAG